MFGELLQGITLNAYFKYQARKINKKNEENVSDDTTSETAGTIVTTDDSATVEAYHHDGDVPSAESENETSVSENDIKDFTDTFNNVSEDIKVASADKVEVAKEEPNSTFKGTESAPETIAIYSNESDLHQENDTVTSDQTPVVEHHDEEKNPAIEQKQPSTPPEGDGWLKNDPGSTPPVKKKPDPKAKPDKSLGNTNMDPIKENMSNLIEKDPIQEKNLSMKNIYNLVRDKFGTDDATVSINTNSASKVAENNSDLDFITEIEKIAKSRGYKIEVRTQCWPNSNIPTGMIEIITFDSNNVMIPDKSFTIDTGCIIDRRRKLIAGLNTGNTCYEMMPIYEIKTKDLNTKKKVLDKQLIESIFAGGINSIRKREMYDPRLKELNRIVDLSTIGNCPSDLKHEITSRLENAYYNTPTFKDVLESNRGATFRFRITSVNTATHEFELTMDNGTCFFGIPNQGILKRYSIKFRSDGTCQVTAL